jgi:integrase/recombinase XerD
MDRILEQFQQDLASAAYSKETQGTYFATAKRLVARFDVSLKAITREQVREFVDEILARGWAPSTKRHQLCALRFLYRKTIGKPEMVSFITLPKKYSPLPTVLSLAEVAALLRAIRLPRYQAMAMVMYGAGLRIAEARVLEVRDIDGARGVIRVRHGKGDKAREAKLSPSAVGRRHSMPCVARFERLRSRRGSRSASRRTCCGTASRRICSSTGPTCGSSARCWTTRA